MHRNTKQVVNDLKKNGRLIEVAEPLSPHLEIAEVQRRVYARGGPAVLFLNPIGCQFPMVSNLFGTLEQARFLFRHRIDKVRKAIELKLDPQNFFRKPTRYWDVPWTAFTMLPKRVRSGPILQNSIQIDVLPKLVSWPNDGGPFVTLPQVLSQKIGGTLSDCNLGMYRVQLAGNDYGINREVGLHYQIHRGIGVHHQQALDLGKPLRVCITIGGSPAMTLAAVMPLPEGLSELTFAGAIAGHRIPMIVSAAHAPLYADADFAIVGTVDLDSNKIEGPFGDHLGYYSNAHPFPSLRVEKVYHRNDAIWPFTVVGRPPQEDTTFGQLIHELTGPAIPTVLPGVQAVHAVDACGVHPLLLAVGSERYTPYAKPNRPQELLTQANAILGQGQLSLAKYLMIIDGNTYPSQEIENVERFLIHLLERIDWRRDLHFLTNTTIDTLDYSGDTINQGSKVIMAASGPKRFELMREIPSRLQLPDGYRGAKLILPGVIVIEKTRDAPHATPQDFAAGWGCWHSSIENSDRDSEWSGLRLVVIVDDAEFAGKSIQNFLWVTFTRSNPAVDIQGVDAFHSHKHWGCRGPLMIDATIKPHHAAPLIEDSRVSARIDALAARGGPLSKYL